MFAPGEPPFLKLSGIGKVFPGVIANEDVSIDFRRGEIHALLGENGAGKSTLMNVVTGLYQPDSGEMILDGYGVEFAGPPAAIAAGIGMVHQHFKLVPRFTVAENLALGWNETPGWVAPGAIEAKARALSERFGLAIRADARIDSLSAGEQQRVEILRVLSRGAKMLILDEPTAVLSPVEVASLFDALRRFRDGGGAVVIITHKLDEVMAVADRCSVLRAGRLVGTHRITDVTPALLVGEMIGRPVDLPASYPRARPAPGPDAPAAMVLEAVSVRDEAGVTRLDAVSLVLRAGEVLGIAGVTGNGQPELAGVMTGLVAPFSGRVLLGGAPAPGADPGAFAAAGVGHVPEDRLRSALAPSLGVAENAVLREYRVKPVGGRLAYNAGAARRFAEALAVAANVRLASPTAPIRGLSGGNQQRLVLAREGRIATSVLVASYPARGLDIGAIAAMRERLAAARDGGVAVVLVSEDLDEILALSDRIAVLTAGRLMGVMERAEARRDVIGRLMSGRAADAEIAA
ncbi:ABC transporter ATP-binding protein [Endobacter medicaginis]|nr:ABC transporter ATP-binding protein [Endobacter medicaginis]MCX5477200.1 ABC transporter ATP-binding protein [Endobacter medicaginis]